MFKRIIKIMFLLSIFTTSVHAEYGGIIDLPDDCHYIGKMENLIITLNKKNGCTPREQNKETYIAFEDNSIAGQQLTIVNEDGSLWKQMYPRGISDGSLTTSQIMKMDHKAIVGKLPNTEEILKDKNNPSYMAAQDITEYANSPEFREQMNNNMVSLYHELYRDKVKDRFDIEELEKFYAKEIEKKEKRAFDGKDMIYLFVSESIPLDTLRAYARAIDDFDENSNFAGFILKGPVGGDVRYFLPTIGFFTKVMKKIPDCDVTKDNCEKYKVPFLIDPFLFIRYDIEQVPAIVYVKDLDKFGSEESYGLPYNANVGEIYKVEGDISIPSALKLIEREAKSPNLSTLIERLERKGYYNNENNGGETK